MRKIWFCARSGPALFSCIYGLVHLMRAHMDMKNIASSFRAPDVPDGTRGPMDMENMVFCEILSCTIFMHLWARAFNAGPHGHEK